MKKSTIWTLVAFLTMLFIIYQVFILRMNDVKIVHLVIDFILLTILTFTI